MYRHVFYNKLEEIKKGYRDTDNNGIHKLIVDTQGEAIGFVKNEIFYCDDYHLCEFLKQFNVNVGIIISDFPEMEELQAAITFINGLLEEEEWSSLMKKTLGILHNSENINKFSHLFSMLIKKGII